MADWTYLPMVQDKTGVESAREKYPATWKGVLFRLTKDFSAENL